MGLKCIMRRAEIIYINYYKLIRIEICINLELISLVQ